MHHERRVERIARQSFRDKTLNVGGCFQILTSHNEIDESVMVIDNRRQVVGGKIVATPNTTKSLSALEVPTRCDDEYADALMIISSSTGSPAIYPVPKALCVATTSPQTVAQHNACISRDPGMSRVRNANECKTTAYKTTTTFNVYNNTVPTCDDPLQTCSGYDISIVLG